jgi:hypothetical protein
MHGYLTKWGIPIYRVWAFLLRRYAWGGGVLKWGILKWGYMGEGWDSDDGVGVFIGAGVPPAAVGNCLSTFF